MKLISILFSIFSIFVFVQSAPLPGIEDDQSTKTPESTYTKPIPPSSPLVDSPEYELNPNIFSNLKSGIHLMGVDVNITDVKLFKYIDSIYLYDNEANKYIIKDIKSEKSISISAYSGFYVYNQVSDNYEISFSVKKPKCTNVIPPIPPEPPTLPTPNENAPLPISSIDLNSHENEPLPTPNENAPLPTSSVHLNSYQNSPLPRTVKISFKVEKCKTLKDKIQNLKEGWNLLGSSKEVSDIKEIFKDAKYVYILESKNGSNILKNIKDETLTIKPNSGFWVYK